MIDGIPLACWLAALLLTGIVVGLAALADRDGKRK